MSRPIHRDDVRRIGIGAVTLLVGGLIAWIGVTVQGGGQLPLKNYTTVKAAFDDVGTLKPQQKVTQAGVRVGQVSDIEYVDGHALVSIRLEGDVTVYQDATARIGNESALGKKYIDFDPGTKEAGELGDSSVLPAAQTADANDLNDLLQAFPQKSRDGLSTALTQVGAGFHGHGLDLQDVAKRSPELLGDATTLLKALNDPSTQLDDVIVTAQALVSQFNGSEAQLANLLDQTSTTLAAVNTEDTVPLQQVFQKAPATLRTARAGLKALNGPLDTTAKAAVRLRPGVDQLVAAMPDLRGFFVESPPVAVTVQKFTKQAEPAVKELVPAVTDLRPLITQRVNRALNLADPFLEEMRPYWPDAGWLFDQHNMLSGKFSPTKHYFSAMVAMPGVYNVSVSDPLADVDPYPGPGKAYRN